MSLCREVFPREHLSTERIVQPTVLKLTLWIFGLSWKVSLCLFLDVQFNLTELFITFMEMMRSERSLGTAPTQVRDDPSSKLTELDEDEEIKADTHTNKYT